MELPLCATFPGKGARLPTSEQGARLFALGGVSIPRPSRLTSWASCFRPQRQATSRQETFAPQFQCPRVRSCGHPSPLLPLCSLLLFISPGLRRKHTTCSHIRPILHFAPGPTFFDLLKDFKSLMIFSSPESSISPSPSHRSHQPTELPP